MGGHLLQLPLARRGRLGLLHHHLLCDLSCRNCYHCMQGTTSTLVRKQAHQRAKHIREQNQAHRSQLAQQDIATVFVTTEQSEIQTENYSMSKLLDLGIEYMAQWSSSFTYLERRYKLLRVQGRDFVW